MIIRYIARRVILIIPTIILTTMIIFLMVRLQPGDVVVARLADSPKASTVDKAELRKRLGLDESIPVQYIKWVGHIGRGDLGKSLWSDRDISPQIKDALPISLEIAFFATLIAAIIGISIGVCSAVFQDSPLDYGLRMISIGGLSVPNFWIGTLLVVLPAAWWGYLPPIIYKSFAEDPRHHIELMIFPIGTLALPLSAGVMRLTRSAVLEMMREDFVRTARAKGLKGFVVTTRHVLPNAIMPVLALIGTQFSSLVGGTLVIESIFGIPGIGRMMFDAISTRDYNVVQAGVFIFAIVFVTVNLLVDLLQVVVDPRIRLA